LAIALLKVTVAGLTMGREKGLLLDEREDFSLSLPLRSPQELKIGLMLGVLAV